MQLLKHLKILLLFSVLYYISLQINRSELNLSKNEIIGTILEINEKEYGTEFVIKTSEKILVRTNGKPTFLLGDKLKITGNIKKVEKSTIFNIFNYEKYLKSKKYIW